MIGIMIVQSQKVFHSWQSTGKGLHYSNQLLNDDSGQLMQQHLGWSGNISSNTMRNDGLYVLNAQHTFRRQWLTAPQRSYACSPHQVTSIGFQRTHVLQLH